MTYTPDSTKTEIHFKNILEKAQKPIFFIMGNDDGILGYNWADTKYLSNIDLKKKCFMDLSFVGYQFE